MTVRRKKPDGEEEVLRISYGSWTKAIHLPYIIGIFLATPFGANFLKATFNVSSPATEQVQVLTNDVKTLKDDVKSFKESVADLAKDMASVKANNSIINSKVDNLDTTFRGFQVDFNRWKPKDIQQP